MRGMKSEIEGIKSEWMKIEGMKIEGGEGGWRVRWIESEMIKSEGIWSEAVGLRPVMLSSYGLKYIMIITFHSTSCWCY